MCESTPLERDPINTYDVVLTDWCPTFPLTSLTLEQIVTYVRKIEISRQESPKVCFFKVYSNKGVDTKIFLRFLLGKECPDSKNLGVLKTTKSGDFETVNKILI